MLLAILLAILLILALALLLTLLLAIALTYDVHQCTAVVRVIKDGGDVLVICVLRQDNIIVCCNCTYPMYGSERVVNLAGTPPVSHIGQLDSIF